ncbi:MAG: hypothetical protein AAF824_15565 [Bacteroidota bacterium]
MDYLKKTSNKDTKNNWDFNEFSTGIIVENHFLWAYFLLVGKGKKRRLYKLNFLPALRLILRENGLKNKGYLP